MTHSLSTFDADSPPAMYRSATLAIVVSNTSMKVGMTTAMATNQGLIAGRLRVLGAMVTRLTWGLFRQEEPRRRNRRDSPASPRSGLHCLRGPHFLDVIGNKGYNGRMVR